jgi:hypothetical protein
MGRTCYKERKLRNYKKINDCKTARGKKKGRPRMRWTDGVKQDLRNLGVVNWRANSLKKFLERAKTHKGL